MSEKVYRVLPQDHAWDTGVSYTYTAECGDGCCSWTEYDFEDMPAGTIIVTNKWGDIQHPVIYAGYKCRIIENEKVELVT